MRRPEASSLRTSATKVETSLLDLIAPDKTKTISPFGSVFAHSISSARVPRSVCSNFLVSSRETVAWRSGPKTCAAAAKVSPMRCGDSKNTMVRVSPTNASKTLFRSASFRGANPSKVNRSVAKPDTASAAKTADGPGTTVISTPAATAARTSAKPGSLTVGIPASDTNSTSLSSAIATIWSARSSSLCSCRL
ncbi:unannotated protein [freshwater metagenome]|uniref:Unannotated protein n=1 Tax=freshwater metagenome TaxID=449393 RepID=A0A6J6BBK2_9ZZZZ